MKAIDSATQDAVRQWNAGKELRLFEVETQASAQAQVWNMAFLLLEHEMNPGSPVPAPIEGLTARELFVATEIVKSIRILGWYDFLQTHAAGQRPLPTVTLQKPDRISSASTQV